MLFIEARRLVVTHRQSDVVRRRSEGIVTEPLHLHAGVVLAGGRPAEDRADLGAWQQHLEANGVMRADTADKPLTQSPIADEPYGSVLVFRDPDNIQLEFFAAAHH